MARKLLYAVVCEQTRAETTNKHMFIGVYAMSMIVDKLPAILPSLVAVACFSLDARQDKAKVRVKVPGKDEQQFDAELTRDNRFDSATIELTLSPLVLMKDGEITVTYEFEDGEKFSRTLRVMTRSAYEDGKLPDK